MLRLNRFCMASAMGAALLASSVMAQPPAGSNQGDGDRPGRGLGAQDGRRGGPPDAEGRGRPFGPGGFRGGPGGPGGFRGGPGGPGGPPPEMMMRMMPVLAALDADGDGKISKAEINNATAALKKLDKNEDGELTAEEMRPDFSAMRGGPGGPGGPGRRGRPPLEEGAQDAAAPRDRGPGRPEGVREVVARMMQMDKNEDGKLGKDELPERMQNMMSRADKNEDGYLSRDELQAVAATIGGGRAVGDRAGRGRPDGAPFSGRIFEQRDANKDGKLSGDEIPEQMSARLGRIDTDGDGNVSRKEFDAMAGRMRDGQGRPGAGPRAGDAGGQPGGQRPRRPDAE